MVYGKSLKTGKKGYPKKKSNQIRSFKGLRRAIQNRYFYRKSGYFPNLTNISKDVSMLKSLINAEKKILVLSGQNQNVAQLTFNSQGAYTLDMTPNPAQGTTDNTRTGDSIKLTTSYLQFQLFGQSALIAPMRIRIEIWRVLGTPQTVSTALGQIYDATVFASNTIRDINSQRNPDYLGQYKLIYSRERRFAPPPAGVTQRMIMNWDIPLRYGQGHHVRLANASQTVEDGQLILFILADSGNYSTASASTDTVAPILAVNTGMIFHYNIKHYFLDN